LKNGAGSTYVAPFFNLAFARYHQQHPAVTVTYSPLGSSAGIAAISARQVDFGAPDVPRTPASSPPPREAPSPRCPTRWAPKASPTT
jgi:ABC-type phosphate transport system substrate-binding protein